MDNNQYNLNRYNRKKQWYRIRLGIGQIINYPVLNILWILCGIGTVFIVKGKQLLLSTFDVPQILTPIFKVCMQFIVIFFPVICILGIMQLIGQITAMRDEGDMSLVFGDRRDMKNQSPILVYKKTIKKKGVTVREFYTTIPMERWQEKKEAICDRLDVHLIGEIEYGGKHNNNGNHIVIKSAKGRKTMERGTLYDETF